MRRQLWLRAISGERRQIPMLIVFCFIVGGWTLTIFPDPYDEAKRLTILEWMWRKVNRFAHREDEIGTPLNQL